AEPPCDAPRGLFPCQHPRRSAPSGARAPLPFVYPPITKSALFVALTLSHEVERLPASSVLFLRLPTTPSSPAAIAASCSATPSSTACTSWTRAKASRHAAR